MNRFSNSRVRTAAADIAAHRLVNIFVAGLQIFREEDGRAHDLPGLAIAALRHIELDPRFLQRVSEIHRKTLDRRDVPAFRARDGRDAGAYRLAIEVYRASTA